MDDKHFMKLWRLQILLRDGTTQSGAKNQENRNKNIKVTGSSALHSDKQLHG